MTAAAVTSSPAAGLALAPMTMDDVDEVHALECSVFPHPWSRANFSDSVQAGYDAWLLRDACGELAGYFLLMYALDEAHLLDVAVAGKRHGTGLGRHMIELLCTRAQHGRGIRAAGGAAVERARAGRVQTVRLCRDRPPQGLLSGP